MPWLSAPQSDAEPMRYELATTPLRIGRGVECDIAFPEATDISRKHADVWLAEDRQIIVADLGSKNGTRVDYGPAFWSQQRVARETIHVGDHTLHIVADEEELRTPVEFGPERTADGEITLAPSTAAPSLSEDRLRLLMDLSERISTGAFNRRQLLEQALRACVETFHFERALLVLKTPRGAGEPPVTHNVQPEQISRTFINRALHEGMRTVINDFNRDWQGDVTESMWRTPISSALCVPILQREEILGAIYGDRVTGPGRQRYAQSDVDFLAAVAQQVGGALANLQLLESHVAMAKLTEEVRRAREIQQALLPREPLEVGGVRLEGFNQPSTGVSGDYFDFFPLPDGRIAFVIADVVGHGLGAALLAANLQAAVHVAFDGAAELPELVRRVNRLICSGPEHMFISAVLGRIDAQRGVVEYCNAGHHPPLLISAGRVVVVKNPSALLLGIDENETYPRATVAPATGSVLALYTDGLIEAADDNGAMLGLDAVIAQLAELPQPPAGRDVIQSMRNRLREHLGRRETDDDLTLLALQFGDGGATAG